LLNDSSDGDKSPLLCSQPSIKECIYAKPTRASLLKLFKKEATPPPPTRDHGKPLTKTTRSNTPAPVKPKATTAKEPTKHDTLGKSGDTAKAAAATAATKANIAADSDAILAQKLVHDEITSSQEAALMASTDEYDRTEMNKQATTLASSSTHKGNQANDTTIKGPKPQLVQPFESVAKAQAKAAAKVQAKSGTLQDQAKIAIFQEDIIDAKAAPAEATVGRCHLYPRVVGKCFIRSIIQSILTTTITECV
jgi:hypothetical protein